jgi:hypothetical protein
MGKETAQTLVSGHFLLRTAVAHTVGLKACAVPGLFVVGTDIATTEAVAGK